MDTDSTGRSGAVIFPFWCTMGDCNRVSGTSRPDLRMQDGVHSFYGSASPVRTFLRPRRQHNS